MSLPLDLLMPAPPARPPSSWMWATVTDTSPLRIRRDGDPASAAMAAESLVPAAALSVGQRVWVQADGQRRIVVGLPGGWQQVVTDLGSLIGSPVTSGVATAGTDWTIVSEWGQKFGPWATAVISVTYSGATLTAGSSGRITDTTMFSLNSAWDIGNTASFYPVNVITKWDSGPVLWGAVIKFDGTVIIQSGIPGLSISSGDTLIAKMTYPLAS